MKKVLKFIRSNFEELFAAGFLIVTTVLVIINVFLRYVMNSGLIWTEEVATGCFVWSVFLGAAACYKRKAHIGVDIIVNALSDKPRWIMNVLVDLILVAINAMIVGLSVQYLSVSYTKVTPVLGVSSAWISSTILFSFTLMTIYSVIFLVQEVRTLGKPAAVTAKEGE